MPFARYVPRYKVREREKIERGREGEKEKRERGRERNNQSEQFRQK
jgi:hypothetical protein